MICHLLHCNFNVFLFSYAVPYYFLSVQYFHFTIYSFFESEHVVLVKYIYINIYFSLNPFMPSYSIATFLGSLITTSLRMLLAVASNMLTKGKCAEN